MRRKVTLAITAALLVAVSACANAADPSQVFTGDATLAALRSAPDAAAEAGSGRFEMIMTIDAPEGRFDIVSTGGFSGEQMTMEMDLGAVLAQAAAASGEAMPDGFDKPMQLVADGPTMYVRFPMLEAVIGTGWISMTPDDLGLAGASLGVAGGANDPSTILETLRGVEDDLVEVGREKVRGIDTTHVRVTVSIEEALAQISAERRAQLESQLRALASSSAGLAVDVWIDGDGLARRMILDMGEAMQAMGETGSVTMTLEFFDYGEPVTVVVPKPTETTPFSGIMGAFGGFADAGS